MYFLFQKAKAFSTSHDFNTLQGHFYKQKVLKKLKNICAFLSTFSSLLTHRMNFWNYRRYFKLSFEDPVKEDAFRQSKNLIIKEFYKV